MTDSERQRLSETHMSTIRSAYGTGYDSLNFISDAAASEAMEHRNALISDIARMGSIGASGTKMDMKRLSPGCRSCVEGKWSCLFINGRCNCRCFYCPTPQDDTGDPITNTLTFTSPEDYAAYVEAFHFNGVSISGGEPFLTFEKSIDYIRQVKRCLGNTVHTWLYTNGSRVTRDKLIALREAGLDEIRFDIGATNYRLKKVSLAAGIIPSVTVEIPAIPEEHNRLLTLLPDMINAGISYLNLHQLRLTPHNFKHLSNRGYTFVHGDKVTVLESELTALDIVRYALSMKYDIGVNYCSFVYKNRFQRAAARLRAAEEIQKPHETVTANGYIRTLIIKGEPERLNALCNNLENRPGISRHCWALESAGKRLLISPDLADELNLDETEVSVAYSEAMLLPAISYFNPFKEIRLSTGKTIYVERQKRLPETVIPKPAKGHQKISDILTSWERSRPFEQVQEGLSDYY